MKKTAALFLGGLMILASFMGCATGKQEEPNQPNVPQEDSEWEQESGEGWVQLMKDRKFDEGFGAGWIYGTTFTGDNSLKKGTPLTYRDIGKDIYIHPLGKAVKEDGITASGVEKNVYWELEEGAKSNITDEYGTLVKNLHDFRLCVNGKTTKNTENEMQIELYNDYMHDYYPEMYNSNPKFVKSLHSDRSGKLTVNYNSYNDISNSAYAYSGEFANNTWPHLYIHQNFREEIPMKLYKKMDYQVTMKVVKAEQINTWPDGPSDRYDQPAVPEGKGHSSSEASLQGTFFFRLKGGGGFFVGMNYWSTNDSNQSEICHADQHGQAFYRIGPVEEQGSYFDLQGEKFEIGKEVTVKYDLYKMVNYVLIRKLQNNQEMIKVGSEMHKNPWYNVKIDDLTLSFYQVGWENMGNWDCSFEMSKLSLKAFTK